MRSDIASCNCEPEYQELIAGRSPHKGEIISILEPLPDTKVDPYQDPAYNQPPPVVEVPDAAGLKAKAVSPRARMAKVRRQVSRLMKKLLK